MRITNKIVNEYLELQAEISRLKKRQEEIKAEMKKQIKNSGPISTKDFDIALRKSEQVRVESKENCLKKLGEKFMVKNNLLIDVVSHSLVISPKEEEA